MRTRTIVALAGVFILVIVFFLPVQSADVEGGVYTLNGSVGYVHYERSLSCQLIPIGIYYWNNQFTLGCTGPIIA